MTKSERAKALALARCRIAPIEFDQKFVRAQAWVAEHDPGVVLTGKQKWALDVMCWKYRRQLAGVEGIELPPAAPRRADYFVAEDEPLPGRDKEVPRRGAGAPEYLDLPRSIMDPQGNLF